MRHRALGSLLAAWFLTSASRGGGQVPNPFDAGPKLPPPAPLNPARKAEILAALSDVITQRAFVPGMDLGKWPSYLATERFEIDAADDDYSFARAVNVAMLDFGVSHIVFFPPGEAQERHRRTAVGVGLSAVAHRNEVTITAVAPKTSADLADLHEGDRILSINGKLPTSELLRGPEGSQIEVRVQPAAGPPRTVRLRSTLFAKVPPAELRMIDPDVAVLKIYGFDGSYDGDRVKSLLDQAKAARYLALDLRSNAGGDGDSVLHLLSLVLPAGTTVGTLIGKADLLAYRTAHREAMRVDTDIVAKFVTAKLKTFAAGAPPFAGKIAVLVNRGTASAAEVATEALRELAGATVVGMPTAGMVLDSAYRRLPYGYEVQFPVRDYVSQAGIRLEHRPIHPDQEVSLPPTREADPCLDAAIQRLRNSG